MPDLGRVIRFLAVAAVGTVCDVAVLTMMRSVGLPLVVCVAAGWCTSVLVTYLLNRRVVFTDSAPAQRRSAWRYGVLSGVNALVAIGGVSLAVSAGAPYLVCRLTASVVMVVVNYLVSRYWVFPRGRTTSLRAVLPLE